MRILVLALALLAAPGAFAQQVTIKLGTLAPEGSTFHNRLKEIGQKWKEASGGRVKLHIYPGGVAGNEGDVIRKMRVGQLNAGTLSAAGLHEILPAAQTPSAPQVVGSYEELDFVMKTMGPELERHLEAKGFVVLHWAEAGTVYFFTRKEARTPADMAGQKLFAWAGDPKAEDAWRAAGFTPVVVSSTDMLPSLQTGLLDAFSNTPLSALGLRWYEQVHYMTDFKWSVLTGATIVNKSEWEKVPADVRPKLAEIAREVGRQTELDVRSEEVSAIAEIAKHGVKIVKPSAAEAAQWRAAAQRAAPVIRGGVVPAETYDELVKLHQQWLASHPN